MKIKMLLAVVVALLLVPTSCGQKAEPLTYVIVPAEEAALSMEQFAPLVNHLSESIGQEVRLVVSSDYNAALEALKYGHADIGRIDLAGYVLAKDKEKMDIVPIVAGIKKKSGKASYKSMIVTLSSGDVHDLNGVSFAFVDVGSTSGYLAPTTYLMEENIKLGEVFFAGSHAAVIEAIKNGTVDAGAIADNRYGVAVEEGVIVEGDFRVLWESSPIFNVPVVVQSSMDAKLKDRLVQAFLTAPRGVVEATGIGEIGFVVATDSDYDQIRKMLRAKELLEK